MPGKATVEGVISIQPDVRDTYTSLCISDDKICPAPDSAYLYRGVSGLLLVASPPGGNWRYGDRVQVGGRLEAPSVAEGFSYRDYLARQGIYRMLSGVEVQLLRPDQGSPLLAFVYRLKARTLAAVYCLFPVTDASLLAWIVLDVESGLFTGVQEARKVTGIIHIIAITGFNMALIAGLFTLAFTRLLGRRSGILAAMLGIGLYTALRTDRDGWIELSTDGESLWVEAAR